MFIMIDGIDGSGKSTIISWWSDYCKKIGKKTFDLKKYLLDNHTFPTLEEVESYDVIVSAEPTHAWIGAAIRSELIAKGTAYTPLAIAQAYALDRLVLYNRLLVPLREQGKIIIQDRGVSTSLCYQSVQKGGLPMDVIANLEGNAFALQHAPDILLLADVSVDIALDRLLLRTHKQDDSIFEKKSFMSQARNTFLSKKFQNHFTARDTKIHILNCNDKTDIIKQEAQSYLKTCLSIK